MKKCTLFISLVSLVVILVVSPIVMTQGKTPVVGVTIYRYDDNFMSFVRRNIEKMIKGKATLIINDSQNSQATQNDQVDVMINRRASVLAINLVDPQAAQTIIDKAKAKGLPLVFFNKEPTPAAMKSYDKVWYVGTKSEESGTMQGQIIVNSWKKNPTWDKNKDGKMQYVMIKGEPGHPDAEARTKYSIDYATENGIKVQKLEEQTAMWDTAKAKDIVDAWISKHGDKIEFIVANNDAMAIGALQAIQARGYNTGDKNKFIPVVGVDAIPDMLNEIKKGTVVGTVLNDALNQAQATVDLSLNAAAGKDPLAGTKWVLDGVKAVRVPYVPITIENIKVGEATYK